MGIQLWSKLEDAGDVTAPQLGTGGAEVGSPTYVAAKFNNGIFSDLATNGCTFPTVANSINMDKGAIGVWWKPNFNQASGTNRTIWDFQSVPTGGLKLYFSEFNDDIDLTIWANGGYKFSITTVGLTWNAGDLIHLAVTWDCTGVDIGGGKTIVLYVNNIEKASSVTTWVAGSGFHATLNINNMDAVIDNIKTYDVCKTDWSDKDTEGEAPPPGVKTLVQAVLISAVPLIAIPTLGQIIKFAGG